MTTSVGSGFARSVVVAALSLACCHAWADWNEGDDYKMHWPQLPDLALSGIDVNATQPWFILGDDFRCTQDGPITNIHIWGSWYHDAWDTGAVFQVSIHADIPVEEPQIPYSRPGAMLWSATLAPASYTVRVYAADIEEGWMEPPNYYEPPTPGPVPDPDTICFQYNFPIGLQAAFNQTSGTVYWLVVQCVSTSYFGWKTSTNHWNDDAVYDNMQGFGWQELRYPDGHPLHPQSIDLAFVIQGLKEAQPEPPVHPECPKWIQPPDCDNGVDVESWAMQEGGAGTPVVADDWLCDGRPVTAIRWWGSYLGYETNNASPTNPPAGSRPVGFLVTWYTDVPSNTYGYSEPGGVISSNMYLLAPFQSNWTGWVMEDTCCVSRLTFMGPDCYEHEYSYYLQLTNEWNEKEPRVYWLSVQAVYMAMPEYHWGWKTTPITWNWNDDAVFGAGSSGWTNMTYPPLGWGFVTNHPYKGQSVDMSFELLTDICPARCKKWAQPPDMILGQDMSTWTIGTNIGPFLRADDFVSDGRPISDIHWWGSYLEWKHDWEFSETNPCPVPGGFNRPTGFTLSWHEHDGANCMPGALITNLFVAISNCHETYYGSVTQFWRMGLFEHEFQYYADLLEEGVDRSWYETNGVHYWLNIQAVFSTNYNPGISPHGGWGWKIAPNTQECLSVVSYDGGNSWRNDIVDTNVPPVHPRGNDNFDLSFELTTTNIPWSTNWAIQAVFTNVGLAPNSTMYMWTTGHCGCGKQVLQAVRHLYFPWEPWVWDDLVTNALPRQQNYWTVAPLSSGRLFRVGQVN